MEIVRVEEFLRYYGRVRERTMRVVKEIPEELIEWRYAPQKFSFGDLLRHLAATERYMWAESVQGRPSRYPGHGRSLADGYEAVMAYLNDRHAESLEIFGSLDDSDLDRRCLTPAGTSLTVAKWLRAMIEHEIHHRGQIYIYLGLNQIAAPPIFGLTSEELLTPKDRATG